MSMDFLSDMEETKELGPRFRLFYILIALTALTFFCRLWFLQIVMGTELRAFSERNRVKEEKLMAPRGMLLDREGRILVDNEPGFEASITPQYASRLEATAQALEPILDMPAVVIVRRVKASRIQNGPFRPIRIKENLSRDQVARIERMRLDNPGLAVNISVKRSYRLHDNSAQLFGYVGEISKDELPRYNRARPADAHFNQGDVIGKSGLEMRYDDSLRGKDGQSFVQVDAHGREINENTSTIFKDIVQTQDSMPGYNLKLTIDKDIQDAAYLAFNKTNHIGGLVALNPINGEILAWANAPSFDPTEFSTGISPKIWQSLVNDPFKPLRNKVIQDHTAPGSTFKAIVALAALEEKVITINSTHSCPGFLKFGKRIYHCHLRQGHGTVNVVHALEQSCDVFFYKVGMALGIDTIAKYARAMGIGSKTDIAMNNEVSGLMPTTEWKKKTFGEEWQPGENLSNSIGQGFVLTTPLQMAVAFGGIAMKGPMFRPFVVKQVMDLDGQITKTMEPELMRDAVRGFNTDNVMIHPENLEIVKQGLREVVNGAHATGRAAKIPGIEMSGKTGTVQLFTLSADQVYAKCANRPIGQRHHGWFVGYAPYEKPELVIAVLAEHACSGGHGAAPVAHDVFLAYFKKYHPDWIEKGKDIKMALAPMAGPPALNATLNAVENPNSPEAKRKAELERVAAPAPIGSIHEDPHSPEAED
jgi:penicillin-binding protein 2